MAADPAAQETSSLISSGIAVAQHSGTLLNELVPSIRKTAELLQDGSTASREQTTGVCQVNKAMTQVDQVMERNASSAEELSSTAEELAAQAEGLQKLIGAFKIAAAANQRPPEPGNSHGFSSSKLRMRRPSVGERHSDAPAEDAIVTPVRRDHAAENFREWH